MEINETKRAELNLELLRLANHYHGSTPEKTVEAAEKYKEFVFPKS